MSGDGRPRVSVVVPTRARPTRLQWLLNALADQSVAAADWEVIVAYDGDPDTARVLAGHPLARAGRLRSIELARGSGPAPKRNAGWRVSRAPLVAFTDDDCRPTREWLEQLLVASGDRTQIVQGRTVPDPDEAHVARLTPWSWSQAISPPSVAAETCNIAYPRRLLERLDGFDEVGFTGVGGEDTDLCVRGLEAGARQVAAPDAVVFHAVEDVGLLGLLRIASRWGPLASLYAKHPALRRDLTLGVFWKPRHPLVLLAGAGLLLAKRDRRALAAMVPYLWTVRPSSGRGRRAWIAGALTVPGRAAVDLVEVGAVARGAIRHRTLLL